MDIKTVLSILSGIVFAFAFVPYITAIVRKQAVPRKVTWLVWAMGDNIVLAGQFAQHRVSGLMVSASLGATIVFLLSLKYGEKGLNSRDKFCLALAIMALGLWLSLGESNLGIAFSLVALMIATWSTYENVWTRPQDEDSKTWLIFNLSSFIGVLAIRGFSTSQIGGWAPAIVFLMIDVPMIYLLIIRPRMLLCQDESQE